MALGEDSQLSDPIAIPSSEKIKQRKKDVTLVCVVWLLVVPMVPALKQVPQAQPKGSAAAKKSLDIH